MVIKASIAESLGTLLLVFAGCGTATQLASSPGAAANLTVAVVFGLVVLTVIYAFGDLSGAHINPAVTLAFLAAGKLPIQKAAAYIPAQFLGGLTGAYLVTLLVPGDPTAGVSLPSGPALQSLGMEILLTWWLMVVIFSVSEGAKEKGIIAGLVVGSTVMLAAAFAGPISGASLNPARSFGPAIVTGSYESLWIYLVAPILGSLLATATHWFFGRKPLNNRPSQNPSL